MTARSCRPALLLAAPVLAGLGTGAVAQGASEPLSLRGTAASAAASPAPSVTRDPVRAPVRQATSDPAVARAVRAPVATLPPPADPDPLSRRRVEEEDPYAPIGIGVGAVTIRPSITQSGGYDSNPRRSRGTAAKGSFLSRTEGEVGIRSDWSRHALDGFLRGSYDAYRDASDANRPAGEGRLTLRLDATRDTEIALETRFDLDTQRPGSPELNVAVDGRPIVAAFGASAGVTQRFNRLQMGLRGSIDRTVYEDARLTNGATLDQGDRNVTQYALRLRTGYEIHPGLIPFVEAAVDTRVHDRAIDDSGFARDSTGVTGRVGSTFELTRTLTGEASVGYQTRDYEDPRLDGLRGAVADAAIVWSASPITEVRLDVASSLDETTIAGASGAISRSAALSVRHDLRRWLTVTATGAIGDTRYDGVALEEDTLSGSVRLDYRLTRSVSANASFTHERLISTSPGSDYTANVYLVGLRLQR